MQSFLQEYIMYSQYFAPRGRERILFLGEQISQRHLTYKDRLIGFVGDVGSGKSSLIKGMFPGLELTNDDDTLNPAKIMQVRDLFEDLPEATTYHIDMRFQMAFTQMHEIIDFINNALNRKRRVIVEHFDRLYPALKRNADIMIGIGEQIIVIRPNIFGPLPKNIYEIVHTSLKYRKMAHTVEDITMQILRNHFHLNSETFYSSDVQNGFVLKFTEKPDIDLEKLSDLIDEKLKANLSVSYYDEDHIMIGGKLKYCSGPRLHVNNTSDIENFELVKKFIKDDKSNTYCLVGLLGEKDRDDDIENLNKLHLPKR